MIQPKQLMIVVGSLRVPLEATIKQERRQKTGDRLGGGREEGGRLGGSQAREVGYVDS